MDSEADVTLDSAENQLKFVLIIKDYPIILSKSCTPFSRKQRTEAIVEVKAKVENEMGIIMTETQIFKKIQNMKSRVKKKSDINTTCLLYTSRCV